ncbi:MULTISPECIES: DUF2798 domain-containing protein [Hydrocarboniphaga]|uniref:DUF2798 domain-containing protein n=1 Tax=Hydrocarboniphaga TaxID=243627 RepID=UPI00058F3093|nr:MULTISPECIES: DUF2798 domain-containing protein [Hydrocarboniphaga]MDZ4077385.1 DUF2798 domain-containing protein [Hydrocarboniphaga sp.]
MIPGRYAPLLFGAILSGLMSLIVSAIATVRVLGFDASFASAWLPAWFMAWAVAFPTVLVIAPITRKIVDGMIVRAP